MAILRMTTVFAQCANELPPEGKIKLPKVFMLLTDNPQHPSLRLRKIQGARRGNIYECSLGRSWRIILERAGQGTYDLVYVGPSDDAIHFGERLREPSPSYNGDATPLARLTSYLAGCDQAMEFLPFAEAELTGHTAPPARRSPSP